VGSSILLGCVIIFVILSDRMWRRLGTWQRIVTPGDSERARAGPPGLQGREVS
jgi:hypothetical protein